VNNNAAATITAATTFKKRSVWGVMYALVRVTRLPHAGVPVLGVLDS